MKPAVGYLSSTKLGKKDSICGYILKACDRSRIMQVTTGLPEVHALNQKRYSTYIYIYIAERGMFNIV